MDHRRTPEQLDLSSVLENCDPHEISYFAFAPRVHRIPEDPYGVDVRLSAWSMGASYSEVYARALTFLQGTSNIFGIVEIHEVHRGGAGEEWSRKNRLMQIPSENRFSPYLEKVIDVIHATPGFEFTPQIQITPLTDLVRVRIWPGGEEDEGSGARANLGRSLECVQPPGAHCNWRSDGDIVCKVPKEHVPLDKLLKMAM